MTKRCPHCRTELPASVTRTCRCEACKAARFVLTERRKALRNAVEVTGNSALKAKHAADLATVEAAIAAWDEREAGAP